MRIGVDMRCFAQGRHSGIEEYTYNLLSALFAADQDNQYVLFFNAWKNVAVDFSWATKHPNVQIKTFHIPNKILNFLLWYMQFPKIDRILDGVDCMFLPNVNFAAVRTHVPLVMTLHDLSFEHHPETFSLKRRLWHFLIAPRRLCRRAQTVVTVSEATAQDVSDTYAIAEKKVTVIPNGLGLQEPQLPSWQTVQSTYALPHHYILSFGAMEPRKNIVALVEAFDQLCTVRGADAVPDLVIAGAHGWKAEKIRAAIAQSPFATKIVVTGPVAQKDRSLIYKNAIAFVYPSHFEGFGLPPLEAMVENVPTITSHATSLPETVGDAAIMIDPEQPDELFRALDAVLAHTDLAEDLRADGRRHVMTFDWNIAAQKLLDVLRAQAPQVKKL